MFFTKSPINEDVCNPPTLPVLIFISHRIWKRRLARV